MVAIPMLMMLRDVIKALGKLLVVIFLVAILNFQNGRHLDFKMAAIFNIFWTISQLLSYLESSKLWQYPCLWCLGFAINALGKLLCSCSFGGHLKFQNGSHLDSKMAAIFNIFWPISLLLSYLESSKWWLYTSMFVMLRIAIKVFGKLLVLFLLHLFWISKWQYSSMS